MAEPGAPIELTQKVTCKVHLPSLRQLDQEKPSLLDFPMRVGSANCDQPSLRRVHAWTAWLGQWHCDDANLSATPALFDLTLRLSEEVLEKPITQPEHFDDQSEIAAAQHHEWSPPVGLHAQVYMQKI